MAWQPIEEKEAERQLIREFAEKIGGKVIKLQPDNDDGETDGVIEIEGKLVKVEARRKGYPNHRGRVLEHKQGWNTGFLSDGIFLNEITIQNHKEEGFIYIVDIKGPQGSEPKACFVNKDRVEILLNQRYRTMKSTNSGNMQSVKTVPLDWFKSF